MSASSIRYVVPITAMLLCGAPTAIAADPIVVTPAARSLQPGELVVLTFTLPDGAERVRVAAFGRELPCVRVGDRTWRALAGIDLDVTPGSHVVSIEALLAGEVVRSDHTLEVAGVEFETRRLRVARAYVDPPAATRARIARDALALAAAWETSAPEPLWAGPFIRPVPGEVVSSFGRRNVLNGEPRGVHAGADFRGAAGTPVHAPNAGRVALARDLYFSGSTVIVDHGLGLFSLFAHLSAFDVGEGDAVTTGQIVGRIGATGRVTGPHLHWAVRVSGARVDPLSLLALLGPESTTLEQPKR